MNSSSDLRDVVQHQQQRIQQMRCPKDEVSSTDNNVISGDNNDKSMTTTTTDDCEKCSPAKTTTKISSAFSISDILSKQDQPKLDNNTKKQQQQQLFASSVAASFSGLMVPTAPYWYPWLSICQLDPNALKQKNGKI